MCFGSSSVKSQQLPPTPPVAPTMADAAVQQARANTQSQAAAQGGLASTQLNSSLAGQGAGKKNLAGTQ